MLRVSTRTIRGWESGATRIPYAAYKLMRVLRGGRYLAHSNWDHFHVRGAVLSTPEGHELPAGDLAWLSLLVRRARAFSGLLPKSDAPLTGCRSLGRLQGDGAVLPQPLDTDSRDALALSPSVASRPQSDLGRLAPAAPGIVRPQGSPPRETGERQMPAIERSEGGQQRTPEAALLSLTIPPRLTSGPPCKPRNTKRAAAMAVQS